MSVWLEISIRFSVTNCWSCIAGARESPDSLPTPVTVVYWSEIPAKNNFDILVLLAPKWQSQSKEKIIWGCQQRRYQHEAQENRNVSQSCGEHEPNVNNHVNKIVFCSPLNKVAGLVMKHSSPVEFPGDLIFDDILI